MTVIDLSSGWELSRAADSGGAGRAPALVRVASPCSAPCSALSVLSRAGLVPEALSGAFESDEVREACASEWTFTRIVEIDESVLRNDEVALEFDSLDTLASVSLGGRQLLHAANAYRPWSIKVRDVLRPGRNVLRVRFRPATPENAPGKPPLSFGGQWSPPLPDCGITGPVRLRAWSGGRIAQLGFGQRHPQSGAVELLVGGWIESAANGSEPPPAPSDFALRIRVRRPDGKTEWDGHARIAPAGGGAFQATIPIRQPRLWWPAGLGEQPLYRVEAALFLRGGGDGRPVRLDARAARIGLRTLVPAATSTGSGAAALLCNGREIFLRGAVWTQPPPCAGERADRAATEPALAAARDARFNAFCLHPGAPPPPPAFWNLCDAYGMVVLGTEELGHRSEVPGGPEPAFLHHACVPDSISGEPDGDTGLVFERTAVAWPDVETLRAALPPGSRSLNGPAAARRCALRGGPAALVAAVAATWPLPRRAEDWPRLTQLAAAARLREAAARARLGGESSGFFFEPFQSAWACADASALDCDGNAKAALYEAARCFAPEALFARIGGAGAPEAVYANDTPSPRRGAVLSWRLAAMDGRTVAQGEQPFSCAAFDKCRLQLPDFSPWLAAHRAEDLALWLVARDREGFAISRANIPFAPPAALALHDPALSASVSQLPDEGEQQVFRISVSAGAAAFGVRLAAQGVPVLWDDNDFALDPDESVDVLATPLRRVDPERFRAALRVTSLYDIAAR